MWPNKEWARYDDRVEAMLHMGAAGVVESLLRTTARSTGLVDFAGVLESQVHCMGMQPSPPG